jgi:hypothetical protein
VTGMFPMTMMIGEKNARVDTIQGSLSSGPLPIGRHSGILVTDHISSQCSSGQLGDHHDTSRSSNVAVMISRKRIKRERVARAGRVTLTRDIVLVFFGTTALVLPSDIQRDWHFSF